MSLPSSLLLPRPPPARPLRSRRRPRSTSSSSVGDFSAFTNVVGMVAALSSPFHSKIHAPAAGPDSDEDERPHPGDAEVFRDARHTLSPSLPPPAPSQHTTCLPTRTTPGASSSTPSSPCGLAGITEPEFEFEFQFESSRKCIQPSKRRSVSLPRLAIRRVPSSGSSLGVQTPDSDLLAMPSAVRPIRVVHHTANDSTGTWDTRSSSSVYPPSTGTDMDFDDSSSFLDMDMEHDQDDAEGHSKQAPTSAMPDHDHDIEKFNADDITYRLRLLVNNNYFLPPAHHKPILSTLSPPPIHPQNQNHSATRPSTPRLFDFLPFRKTKNSSTNSSPMTTPHIESPVSDINPAGPLLRNTADTSSLGGLLTQHQSHPYSQPQSRPLQRQPLVTCVPVVPAVVVVREQLPDLEATIQSARQAERERDQQKLNIPTTRGRARAKTQSHVPSHAADTSSALPNHQPASRSQVRTGNMHDVDPTDAVDAVSSEPKGFPLSQLGGRALGLGLGLGLEGGLGDFEAPDVSQLSAGFGGDMSFSGSMPGSPGPGSPGGSGGGHGVEMTEAWRRMILEKAVSMSLTPTPDGSFAGPSSSRNSRESPSSPPPTTSKKGGKSNQRAHVEHQDRRTHDVARSKSYDVSRATQSNARGKPEVGTLPEPRLSNVEVVVTSVAPIPNGRILDPKLFDTAVLSDPPSNMGTGKRPTTANSRTDSKSSRACEKERAKIRPDMHLTLPYTNAAHVRPESPAALMTPLSPAPPRIRTATAAAVGMGMTDMAGRPTSPNVQAYFTAPEDGDDSGYVEHSYPSSAGPYVLDWSGEKIRAASNVDSPSRGRADIRRAVSSPGLHDAYEIGDGVGLEDVFGDADADGSRRGMSTRELEHGFMSPTSPAFNFGQPATGSSAVSGSAIGGTGAPAPHPYSQPYSRAYSRPVVSPAPTSAPARLSELTNHTIPVNPSQDTSANSSMPIDPHLQNSFAINVSDESRYSNPHYNGVNGEPLPRSPRTPRSPYSPESNPRRSSITPSYLSGDRDVVGAEFGMLNEYPSESGRRSYDDRDHQDIRDTRDFRVPSPFAQRSFGMTAASRLSHFSYTSRTSSAGPRPDTRTSMQNWPLSPVESMTSSLRSGNTPSLGSGSGSGPARRSTADAGAVSKQSAEGRPLTRTSTMSPPPRPSSSVPPVILSPPPRGRRVIRKAARSISRSPSPEVEVLVIDSGSSYYSTAPFNSRASLPLIHEPSPTTPTFGDMNSNSNAKAGRSSMSSVSSLPVGRLRSSLGSHYSASRTSIVTEATSAIGFFDSIQDDPSLLAVDRDGYDYEDEEESSDDEAQASYEGHSAQTVAYPGTQLGYDAYDVDPRSSIQSPRSPPVQAQGLGLGFGSRSTLSLQSIGSGSGAGSGSSQGHASNNTNGSTAGFRNQGIGNTPTRPTFFVDHKREGNAPETSLQFYEYSQGGGSRASFGASTESLGMGARAGGSQDDLLTPMSPRSRMRTSSTLGPGRASTSMAAQNDPYGSIAQASRASTDSNGSGSQGMRGEETRRLDGMLLQHMAAERKQIHRITQSAAPPRSPY